MFVSLTKMTKKLFGIRLGFGIRITKKNAVYMWLVLLIAVMVQLTIYLMIPCVWLVCAMMYGFFWLLGWCGKKIGGLIGNIIRKIAK